MFDLSKCLVTSAIHKVNSSIFVGVVEHTLRNDVEDFDAQTAQNLLFFLSRASQNHTSHFIASILKHIETENWLRDGKIYDHVLLSDLILENRQVIADKDSTLLEQLETAACQRLFSGEQIVSLDILALYAYKFAQMSEYAFPKFFQAYFDYLIASRGQLKGLSIEALSNVAVSLVTHRMTDARHVDLWRDIRDATAHYITDTENKIDSAMQIQMLLSIF